MKKIGLGILVGVVAAVLTVGVALALPTKRGIDIAKERSPVIDEERNVDAPPTVPVFPQLPESELTKVVFIRYAPGKEPICVINGICEPRENWKNCPEDCKKGGEEEPPTTTCYAFLSGAKPKWNWIEDYVYNDGTLAAPSADAVTIWETPVSGDIFGNGVSESYPWGKYDYYNSISYDDYPEEGVLAVTAIWFRGKNIYEYDIMFDTDYPWGDATVDPTVFDLPTVTLHEFGHGAGLNDLYDAVCSGNVMYWQYTGVKGTLAEGDVTGIQTLYGK